MKDLTQQYVEQLENMVKDLIEKKLDLEEENKKLKAKLSKREQWEYRYFWNDGEQDIYEITSIKDWPITYSKDSTWKWVADWEPPYVLC